MRKPAFCICSKHAADRRLCFGYTNTKCSTMPLLLNPKPLLVVVQPGLWQTWLETPKTGFSHDSSNTEMPMNSLGSS